MVVGLALAAIQMGMALPTGFLFGVGYGTGVRIGYEQVYPLLFPKGARSTTSELAATMKGMNTVYDAIGGKDASRMGIAVGITNAGEILNNPDFQVLEKLESSSSGLTSSSSNRTRYGLDQESPPLDTLASEIEEFNLDTGSEKWSRYRTYTITQLRNIIISTTNEESKRIATAVLNEKLQQDQGTGTTTILSGTPSDKVGGEFEPSLTKSLEQAKAFTAWQKNLIEIQKLYKRYERDYLRSKGVNPSSAASMLKLLKIEANKILNISKDYRNPNNGIRTAVLQLRKQLAAGHWSRNPQY